MRFSQNGLQLALARLIFYAETKFHGNPLRNEVRTASRVSLRLGGPQGPYNLNFEKLTFARHSRGLDLSNEVSMAFLAQLFPRKLRVSSSVVVIVVVSYIPSNSIL